VTPSSDPFQLERRGVEVTVSAAQLKQWIDDAASKKQWLILSFHDIDLSGSRYSIPPARFNEVIDYLAASGIPVIPVSLGIDSL
jgi:hypothetical protein